MKRVRNSSGTSVANHAATGAFAGSRERISSPYSKRLVSSRPAHRPSSRDQSCVARAFGSAASSASIAFEASTAAGVAVPGFAEATFCRRDFTAIPVAPRFSASSRRREAFGPSPAFNARSAHSR